MKKLLLALFLVFATAFCAFADNVTVVPATLPAVTGQPTSPATDPALGWGPSAVASVGAFYLNGNYHLLAGGFGAGAAYTFSQGTNINSAGIYLGPQSAQVNGQTTTSMDIMLYCDLFQTKVGQFGVGLGYDAWKSGNGLQVPTRNNTFFALNYKF